MKNVDHITSFKLNHDHLFLVLTDVLNVTMKAIIVSGVICRCKYGSKFAIISLLTFNKMWNYKIKMWTYFESSYSISFTKKYCFNHRQTLFKAFPWVKMFEMWCLDTRNLPDFPDDFTCDDFVELCFQTIFMFF